MRILGTENYKIGKDVDISTLSQLVLCNLKKGDEFFICEKPVKVLAATDKMLKLNINGKNKIIRHFLINTEKIYRDIEGELLLFIHTHITFREETSLIKILKRDKEFSEFLLYL